MKYLFITLLFVVGCAKKGLEEKFSNNSNFTVNYLFEHDKCKVYRFADNGRYHYFTNCTGTISGRTESCGKNCNTYVQENIDNRN